MGEKIGVDSVLVGNLREGGHLEHPYVSGRMIAKWIVEKRDARHGLDQSGSGRDRWWAVVNAIMNLQVP
jgi:hypothetical protein